jgi:hypothetical protein
MKRKHYFIAAAIVLVLSGVITAPYAFRVLIGDSGKTADAAVLGAAYRRAGPQFEGVYTSELSEFVPSAGEVSWVRTAMRPSMTITGKIDTVKFRQFMTNHESIHFGYSRNEVSFRSVKDVGDAEIITDGNANLTSGDLWMVSFFGIYKHGNK